MAVKIYRINYKSDFILTLESDAGWMTPFCIKFWTGAPSQAFFAQWDGTTHTHCAYNPSEPTKLTVQFDDHHLPIGDLKFQIAYHFTVADFPNDTEDEVINPANITTEIDGEAYQVMLDFIGETAPEIQFSLPAYANEQQRIENELQREQNEAQRIENEQQRESQEQARVQAEQRRVEAEQERVSEFNRLKRESESATRDANAAAELATQKAGVAQTAADNADAKAQYAKEQGDYAKQQAESVTAAGQYATAQGDYAKQQGQAAQAAAGSANYAAALATQKAGVAQSAADNANAKAQYAKEQGDYAKAQGDYAKQKGDDAAVQMQQQAQDFSDAQAARTQTFNQSQTERQTAYQNAEGTESGSVAGDGSRWGAFKTNEAARDAEVDAKVADITNLQERVLYMEQCFGKYDTKREITLSQAKSGKYVSVAGAEVSASGYGISNSIGLLAGDLLLIPSAQAMPADVSVVARIVTRTYQKVINYTYTYQQANPELYDTATADYDPTLVYTAVYDTSGDTPVLTGWTRGGQTYTTLPETHEVTESYYEPLIKQSAAAMPSTGYYVYLCPQAMTVVISGLTATVSGGVCIAVGWGIFKNIVSNFLSMPGQNVVAQSIAVLTAAVAGHTAQLQNLGETKAKCIDSEDLPKVCGAPLVIEGAGAPSVVPMFVGQRYHDTTNKKVYEAFAVTNSTANWTLLN